MASKTVQARALLADTINGVAFECNDLVEGPAHLIDQHCKEGRLDRSNQAVAYARSHGARVDITGAPEPATEEPKGAEEA